MKIALIAGVFLFCMGSTAAFAQGFGDDNIWTNNNRWEGPIPYRDITAYMPAGGCDQSSVNIFSPVSGVIMAGNLGQITLASIPPYFNNNGCGIFIAGAGPTSSLATPAQGSAPNPKAFGGGGVVGSITVDYEVVAIDAKFGTSAASVAITITSAPAPRTPAIYVGVYWTSVANAVGYLVYSDASGSCAPLSSHTRAGVIGAAFGDL